MMLDQIQAFSAEMLAALDAEMKNVLHATTQPPDPFFGMLHYHMGWVDQELEAADVNGGKRIRPILCLLTCQAAGGDWRQALPAAAAIEILHNFSLIHDDIEDASPTRRGRLTVWKIWGVEQAINSGDAMFALAHLALNRLIDRGVPAETVVRALRRFDETCVQLTQGQHADMDFETRSEVSVAEYLTMITGKTAVLISLCTELGALIAGANPETISHYSTFGRDLGLAFQVKDDILGIWGDETHTGKSTATDIITRKKTLPVLDGLAKSERLRELYQSEATGNGFVREVTTILDEVGSHTFAVEKAAAYSENALHHLQAADPQGEAGDALQHLTNLLLRRNY